MWMTTPKVAPSVLPAKSLWSVQEPSVWHAHEPMRLAKAIRNPAGVAAMLAQVRSSLPLLDLPDFLEKFPYVLLLVSIPDHAPLCNHP